METNGMARRSKHEYLRVMWPRYQRAGRAEKTLMLDEFIQVCGYHRKYALWLLNRPLPESPRPRRVARRPPRYSEAMIRVLAQVWEASGYLCSQRLQAALPQWLPWMRPRVSLTAALERQLLAISPRQMDRRLQPRKRTLTRRLYGTTRPGSLLKHQIPIKTDHWDVHQPGYLEIDLVSHSGASASGEFLHTLDGVDIQTCWVERQAVRGKGQAGILHALRQIEQQLPFSLRGIDSDNGSEFINAHMVAFCQRPGNRAIQFTRSRPYKKDDNAHVEQKNWTHVRKLVGWDRYDSAAALQALNALYADLRLFQNLFQPSMKLLTKVRKGSRLIRRYDRPQTPFARVCACSEADPEKVAALRLVLAQTDPFALSQRIDQQLDRLSRVARQPGPIPRAMPPHSRRSPWHGWTFSRRAPQPAQASAQPPVKNPAHTVALGATIPRSAKGEARGKTAARGAGVPGKIFR
ncbi:MAG: transposase family protein [Nitrospira sp.]|jgi:hypothetical protein|nr:MAG: transposase family protein [Nitrospira sp.]